MIVSRDRFLPALSLLTILLLAGAQQLHAAADRTWDGTGSTTSNWSEAANWNTKPVTGDGVIFATNNKMSNNNDNSGFTYRLITFNNTCGAATLDGQAITLTGNITNSDADSQTIKFNIALSGAYRSVAATSGVIAIT
ncbi:MAG: hypothetical protein MUF22_08575, partial [Chitinispirillaceae bacterium]|nr:hypothetical protein [Chitinispirillaceae bacterium]